MSDSENLEKMSGCEHLVHELEQLETESRAKKPRKT